MAAERSAAPQSRPRASIVEEKVDSSISNSKSIKATLARARGHQDSTEASPRRKQDGETADTSGEEVSKAAEEAKQFENRPVVSADYAGNSIITGVQHWDCLTKEIVTEHNLPGASDTGSMGTKSAERGHSSQGKRTGLGPGRSGDNGPGPKRKGLIPVDAGGPALVSTNDGLSVGTVRKADNWLLPKRV
ncbi:hypothetical protein F2P79_006182 [Pimephales promelas]|nr:hypothetical protein F2P79_006182 [Pimephales promelas]